MGGAYREAFRHWLSLLITAFLLALLLIGVGAILFGLFLVPLIAATAAGQTTDAAGAIAAFGVLCVCFLILPALLVIAFFYTRWVFWTQAIMLENYNSTGALGRSWKLVRGSFWRVLAFVILLAVLVYALSFGVGFALSVVAFFLPSPMVQFLVQSAIGAVLGVIIAPLQYATLTVLYYDLRIRKEGFDLVMQLRESPEPPMDLPPLAPGTTG